jgi:hypothetical protein
MGSDQVQIKTLKAFLAPVKDMLAGTSIGRLNIYIHRTGAIAVSVPRGWDGHIPMDALREIRTTLTTNKLKYTETLCSYSILYLVQR